MKVTKATAKAPIDWVNPSYRATPPVLTIVIARSIFSTLPSGKIPSNVSLTTCVWIRKMPIRVFEPNEISPREILSSRRDEIRKSVSQRPVFHSFNSNSNHSNHHSRRHRHHSFHR